ncbi:hypothetical protein SLU01_21200 [Sporosarcina luteola]|uniref:Uncharacterized protein n=1 Tax=Sporosarcina luteola TaxID=582850 RepID=A0A511Z8P1_9BACL|nr:hypothetical protein [Sporosarcina luteola]GEN83808.1 hypothetical protein SLU01_21200 [Sporosarcina luteola]
MYYWYNPYLVHAAYPPSVRHISPPAIMGNMIAMPTGKNSYPAVNTNHFRNSAKQSMDLMKQANLLVTKITESDTFRNELMMTAQASNQKKVDEMITTAGITTSFETKFTPDGIGIHFQNKTEEGVCCELILILHW